MQLHYLHNKGAENFKICKLKTSLLNVKLLFYFDTHIVEVGLKINSLPHRATY